MSAESPSRPYSPNGRRSNSFVGGFIKRSRSSDLLGERKSSNNLARDRINEGESVPQSPVGKSQTTPPQLPTFEPQPHIQTFGGENYISKMEIPKAVATTPTPPPVHVRTDSITNRGRYSYATSTVSSVNSPRRVRKRKDPISYNVLVIGARNSGKTSFLNFLKSSIAPHPEQQNVRNPELDSPPPSHKSNPGIFVQHYLELEMDNERVGLNIWDSQGFEKHLVDFQLRELNNFVESKFEDTFIEEMKVVRTPGYRDTHIHCVFFLFDPARLDININAAKKKPTEMIGSLSKPTRVLGALDEDFELQILRSLQGKTTVIPVISKADTVTAAHMTYLKKMVGESFQQAGLDPLEALHFEQSDGGDDALDEVDEDVLEDVSVESETPGASEVPSAIPENNVNGDDAPKVEPDTVVPPPPPPSNGIDATTPEETQANTKKTLTHKRENSKLSVSNVMFDNGYMPMSILNPDEHSLNGNHGPIGRKFIWGFADPYNPEHCDFLKLKETCFNEWRTDFKETSRELFYERWRTGRLNRANTNGGKQAPVKVPAAVTRKPSGGIPIELTPRGKRYT